MIAGNKPWWRVIAAAAFACTILTGAPGARAEEPLTFPGELFSVGDGGATVRSGPQKELVIEPPAALLKFSLRGLDHRERAWDVAAHASAGNDIRFQRAFFLSAYLRF